MMVWLTLMSLAASVRRWALSPVGGGDVSTFSLHSLLKLVTDETGKHKSFAQFLFLFLLPGMTCAGGRRLRTNTGTRSSLGDRSTSEK